MIVIEWMPPHHRSSHVTAGNSGRWPTNGASRIAIDKDCLEFCQDGKEDEWCQVISGDDPERYAELAER
jgi:hypothetical protein